MNQNSRRQLHVWLAVFGTVLAVLCLLTALLVYSVDPFFHYHAPRADLYYPFTNERYDSDGILWHFDYDAVITGTSMTECFRPSQLDALFNTRSVKVPSYGASYHEISQRLRRGFRTHGIRMVVWGLDQDKMIRDPEWMRDDLGDYPYYLYDDNPFNDVKYLLNKEVLFEKVIPILENKRDGAAGGHDGFDDYVNWSEHVAYGPDEALEDFEDFTPADAADLKALTPEEEQMVRGNVDENVASLAAAHPDTLFCLFLTPYSVVYWGQESHDGTLDRQLAAERILLEELMPYANVLVLSYNNCPEVIENLDNYRDALHYGGWINDRILEDFATQSWCIRPENLNEYLEEESHYLHSFDYTQLPLEKSGNGRQNAMEEDHIWS